MANVNYCPILCLVGLDNNLLIILKELDVCIFGRHDSSLQT